MLPTVLTVALPSWIPDFVAARSGPWSSDDAQMGLVLDLTAEHVRRRTGGPFGAAVFDARGGLVSVGVNLVEPARAAVAHAEIVALALAGQAIGAFDLGARGPTTLVASTEPCAMCLGSVPWSGVSRVVCGAADADARHIGFDEGTKPVDWVEDLGRRGIGVALGVSRSRAAGLLQDYARSGGAIYNGTSVAPGGGG